MIRTRRIVLRPVVPADYGRLYELENDPGSLATWRYRGSMPTVDEYETALWQHTAQIMVVESRSTGRVVGYAQLHDLDLRAGHASLSVFAGADHRGSGLVMEGTMAFCEWAFANWPLRWLIAHCLPDNLRHFESAVRRGEMVLLGVLRDRVLLQGRATDVHVLGMERQRWMEGTTRRRFTALRGGEEERP